MFKRMTTLILGFLLVGCHSKPHKHLIIGTMSGPEADLVTQARKVLSEKYHVTSQQMTFGDYQLPNAATQSGDLDINVFQHQPFLSFYHKHHPSPPLYVVGKTFLYPMGLYARSIKYLKQVPDGATVAIPNDPTNETRALKLLAQAQWIKLTQGEVLLTTDSITQNPKHLKIVTMAAAAIPRALQDVDVAAINTTYALPAGLNPKHDALLVEKPDSAYANIIVSRHTNADPQVHLFVKAMHDPSVVALAKKIFKGAAIPAWR